jgi:hypothetical protein
VNIKNTQWWNFFNITFEDGTIDLPYGGDFIYSEQFTVGFKNIE